MVGIKHRPRGEVLPCPILEHSSKPEAVRYAAVWLMAPVCLPEYRTRNRRSGHCASSPRPATSWPGEFDATVAAATPPQNVDPPLPPANAMSENCLQLNAWAPRASGPHPSSCGSMAVAINRVRATYPSIKVSDLRVTLNLCQIQLPCRVLGSLSWAASTAPLGWQRQQCPAGSSSRTTVGPRQYCRIRRGFVQCNDWRQSGERGIVNAHIATGGESLFQQVIIASGGGDAVYTPTARPSLEPLRR